jgi:hypothetical protein
VLSSHAICLWSVWVRVGSATAGSLCGVRGFLGWSRLRQFYYVLYSFFSDGFRGGGFWALVVAGWDCGDGGGCVGQEADWRCVSPSRLLLGDGPCSVLSLVHARSLRRFNFPPPSMQSVCLLRSSSDYDLRSSRLDAWADEVVHRGDGWCCCVGDAEIFSSRSGQLFVLCT